MGKFKFLQAFKDETREIMSEAREIMSESVWLPIIYVMHLVAFQIPHEKPLKNS